MGGTDGCWSHAKFDPAHHDADASRLAIERRRAAVAAAATVPETLDALEHLEVEQAKEEAWNYYQTQHAAVVARHHAEIEAATAGAAEAQRQLAASERARAELETRLAAATTGDATTQEEVERVLAERDRLTVALTEAEAVRQTHAAEMRAAAGRVAEADRVAADRIAEAQALANDFFAQLSDAREEIARRDREAIQLHADLEAATRAITEHAAAAEAAAASDGAHRAQIAELQAVIRQKETEIDAARAAVAAEAGAEAEAALGRLRLELRTLQATHAALVAEFDTSRATASQIGGQLRELQAAYATLNEQNSTMSDKYEAQMEQLRAQFERELQQSVQAATEECADCDRDLGQCRASVDECRGLTRILQADRDQVQAEREGFRQRMAAAEAAAMAFEAEAQGHRGRAEALAEVIESERAGCQAELARRPVSCATIEQARAALEVRVEDLERQLRAVDDEVHDAKTQAHADAARAAELAIDFDTLQNELHAAYRAVEDHHAVKFKLAQAREEIAALKSAAATAAIVAPPARDYAAESAAAEEAARRAAEAEADRRRIEEERARAAMSAEEAAEIAALEARREELKKRAINFFGRIRPWLPKIDVPATLAQSMQSANPRWRDRAARVSSGTAFDAVYGQMLPPDSRAVEEGDPPLALTRVQLDGNCLDFSRVLADARDQDWVASLSPMDVVNKKFFFVQNDRYATDPDRVFNAKTQVVIDTYFDEVAPQNVVYIAYGASGSGKTHTTEQVLNGVFDKIGASGRANDYTIAMFSDYLNNVYDYLGTTANEAREEQKFNAETGTFARPKLFHEGLVKMAALAEDVALPPGAKSILDVVNQAPLGTFLATAAQQGMTGWKFLEELTNKFRRTDNTGLNIKSSRGHMVYVIQDTTRDADTANFVVVDLAGTENLSYLIPKSMRDRAPADVALPWTRMSATLTRWVTGITGPEKQFVPTQAEIDELQTSAVRLQKAQFMSARAADDLNMAAIEKEWDESAAILNARNFVGRITRLQTQSHYINASLSAFRTYLQNQKVAAAALAKGDASAARAMGFKGDQYAIEGVRIDNKPVAPGEPMYGSYDRVVSTGQKPCALIQKILGPLNGIKPNIMVLGAFAPRRLDDPNTAATADFISQCACDNPDC